MRTTQLQKALNSLWTVDDLCARSGKTAMTINNWRQKLKLPTVVIPSRRRAAIRFVPHDVQSWAKKNGIHLSGQKDKLG